VSCKIAEARALCGVFVELSGLSAREAAEALNRRGITTAWGYKWRASQVRLVRARLARAAGAPVMPQQASRDTPVRTGTGDTEQGPSPRHSAAINAKYVIRVTETISVGV
jgi:hypothetical protein